MTPSSHYDGITHLNVDHVHVYYNSIWLSSVGFSIYISHCIHQFGVEGQDSMIVYVVILS